MYSSWTTDGDRGELQRAPLGRGGAGEHRAIHPEGRARRVVGIDLDGDPQALERGQHDAQRVTAALGGDAGAGPQLGHQIQAAVGRRQLEPHDVRHQQGDEPVTPARRVTRIRATVGTRQTECLQGEVGESAGPAALAPGDELGACDVVECGHGAGSGSASACAPRLAALAPANQRTKVVLSLATLLRIGTATIPSAGNALTLRRARDSCRGVPAGPRPSALLLVLRSDRAAAGARPAPFAV